MIQLSLSLFCNTTNWNVLISNGIIPFINNKELLTGYTIEFNYLSGENIRLALITEQENAPELAKKADNYFRDFFKDTGFITPEIKLPVNGVFMPFPANSIQYGLYPPLFIEQLAMPGYMLPIGISQIIAEALKDDVIDDETILTFAFYLNVGLIKIMDVHFPMFAKTFNSKSVIPEFIHHQKSDMNTFREKFEESKETLVEIFNDIWQPANETNNPEWLGKWLLICDSEINKSTKNESDAIYQKINLAIQKHLGISHKLDNMLNYFIDGVFRRVEIFNQKKGDGI